MGDGINDAAAMRASDCGISVDSAVDIAKESAEVVSPPVLPAPELLELPELFPQPASMLVTIRLASNTDTIFFFMLFLLYFAAFSAVKYVNIFVFLL